jgi:hypothetical protein
VRVVVGDDAGKEGACEGKSKFEADMRDEAREALVEMRDEVTGS